MQPALDYIINKGVKAGSSGFDPELKGIKQK